MDETKKTLVVGGGLIAVGIVAWLLLAEKPKETAEFRHVDTPAASYS